MMSGQASRRAEPPISAPRAAWNSAQRVRDYAKLNETPEMAAKAGMEEMSEKFQEMSSQVYVEAGKA